MSKFMEHLENDHYSGLRNSETPERVFKFYSLGTGRKNDKRKLKTLARGNIWVDVCNHQNDPFEFINVDIDDSINTDDEDILKLYNNLKSKLEKIKPKLKLSSFTRLMDTNISMRAYYTNNFRGFCCEFNAFKNPNSKTISKPIEYQTKIKKIDQNALNTLKRIISLKNYKFLNFELYEDLFDNVIKELSFYKGKTWEHEQEYRAIYKSQIEKIGEEVSFSDLNVELVAIYIGLNCSKKNTKKLYKIASKLNVKIYQIDKDKNEYKLITDKGENNV